MPGKHVHFIDGYSPMPSPTFSLSSLTSSSGPFTPPPVGYHALPQYPAFSSTVVYKIHPILGLSSVPYLINDVSLPASLIKPRNPKLSQLVLSEPATEPALPYLEVISAQLPWRIAVHPAPNSSGVVTVADVLYAIYQTLRLPVSPTEFALIPTGEMRDRIGDAYRQRCQRLSRSDEIAHESKKGIKRIDFLLGQNTFLGLSSTKEGGHIWRLNTSS